MLILRHVHTSWDTVWHLWTKVGASKSEELYLHMTSSVGYLFSSTPKHSLIPWLPFLTEALVLSKEMNFVATSLSTEPTYQMTNTHFPCGRYAWVLNGLFYRVPRQTWHHFLHDFVTSEFFLIFSLWKRRWQCEKKSAVEGKQQSLSSAATRCEPFTEDWLFPIHTWIMLTAAALYFSLHPCLSADTT